MKHRRTGGAGRDVASRPARGAWIETDVIPEHPSIYRVAPRAGRVD